MMPSFVPPERNKRAFHCPHCNVMAQQVWQPLSWTNMVLFVATPQEAGREGASCEEVTCEFLDESTLSLEVHREVSEVERARQHPPVRLVHADNLNMLAIAECQNCWEVSIWLYEEMLFPDEYGPPPNPDLTEEIKKDYREAAAIAKRSPRGACALLRLCLEKLCDHLGARGGKTSDKIGWLVREKNLSTTVEQAFRAVRVVGIDAAQPRQLDLRDDKETALSLLTLVNLVADFTITQPKRIREMYSNLPGSKGTRGN